MLSPLKEHGEMAFRNSTTNQATKPTPTVEKEKPSQRRFSLRRKRKLGARPSKTLSNDDRSSIISPHHTSVSKKTKRRSSFNFLSRKNRLNHSVQSVDSSTHPPSESEKPIVSVPPKPKGESKQPRRSTTIEFLRKSVSVLQREQSQDSNRSGNTARTASSDEPSTNSVLARTRVVPEAVSPKTKDAENGENKEILEAEHEASAQQDLVAENQVLDTYDCATAILGHSYIERMCGFHSTYEDIHDIRHALSEDPTVRESVECIFASQLEDGLGLWDDEDEDNLEPVFEHSHDLVSPAGVQQSRMNRRDRQSTNLAQNKKRYEQASLVYVGTFDPTVSHDDLPCDDHEALVSDCPCSRSELPALHPSDWPQAPLLLRPTPGSGTHIKGVRLGNSKEYFWQPESHLTWAESLAKKWGKSCPKTPRVGCCEKCAVLPINNGNEAKGESMIIDFESDLFEGSLLLRLRHSEGTTPLPYDDNKGYFHGMNRRYQGVVRGRFKKSIPLTELVTGFQFKRPCGKLPPKWIMGSAFKVLSFFAPQLDAKLDGRRPHSLTPLGSTPQSITVDYDEIDTMECMREEPVEAERTLLGDAAKESSSLKRAKARKKAFDKLFVQKAQTPKSDPSKIYTFEFLQHLLNFQDYSIELGPMLGNLKLDEVLNGQPLQIMASHGEHRLWSFDLWHECLWEQAKQYDAAMSQ